jgi:hypothetical protein
MVGPVMTLGLCAAMLLTGGGEAGPDRFSLAPPSAWAEAEVSS